MHPLIDNAVFFDWTAAHALGPLSFCQHAGSAAIKGVCLTGQFSNPLLHS